MLKVRKGKPEYRISKNTNISTDMLQIGFRNLDIECAAMPPATCST